MQNFFVAKNADGDFWLKEHRDFFKNIPVLEI